MDGEQLITLQNGGVKCLSALPGGRAVFALTECVRAAVGSTGQGWTLHRRWTVRVHSGQLFRLCTEALVRAAAILRQRAIEFRA